MSQIFASHMLSPQIEVLELVRALVEEDGLRRQVAEAAVEADDLLAVVEAADALALARALHELLLAARRARPGRARGSPSL